MDYERVTVGKSSDAAGTKPPFVDIHILLVDDDATTLAIVSAMLRTMRYQVSTVKNPVDALATLRMKKGLFDIVVTDLHMPFMNGFELQKRVDEEFKLPVIMMSADDKESVILKSLEGGVAYFMVKPVSPDDLKNVWQYAVAAKKGKSVIIEEIDSVHGDDQPPSGHQKTSNSEDKNSATTTPNIEEKVVRGRKECKRKVNQEDDEEYNDVAPKKAKVVWTNSLHNRFLLAIRHISLERAVPKRILEFMNVPGLTRENVASHLQKYRIFLKRVAERGALTSKGALSDRVFRSSFASGHQSLRLKNVQKDDDDQYSHYQFPRRQQMITSSTTSPLTFQQGFTRNHNTTSTTPNASNAGLFRLHGIDLPKLGFGHSNSLTNNHANIQQPIRLAVGGTNPKPWVNQASNYPGFGIQQSNLVKNGGATSYGVNNGRFINGANDHNHQNLPKPGLFSATAGINNTGYTTPVTIKNKGTTLIGNNNPMANSGCHPSSNFAGGVQTNSTGGGVVVGLGQPGFNINTSNGYGLVSRVGNDNVNKVAPVGNNIEGSNMMGYVGQGDSSSSGFESANQNQALVFPNTNINQQQQQKYGLTNGDDHAQPYATQNDFISDLFMDDRNLESLFQPQGGDQGLVSNTFNSSYQAQLNPASPNQSHNPNDCLSHLVQQNSPFQQSLGEQHHDQGSEQQVVHPEYGNSVPPSEEYNPCSDQYPYQYQGSLDKVVDCELNDIYQDWDDFMDSLLNTSE